MARLEEAQAALDGFAQEYGSDEENTIDLMTDLLLLAMERGDDADAILRMVKSNYEAEKESDEYFDEDETGESEGPERF